METAIAKSCDVYFYDLANMLGVDRLSDLLGHFGIGSYTGIDINGERRGILPTRGWKQAYFKDPAEQIWFPGETVIFGIGQGYLDRDARAACAHDVDRRVARQESISRAWSRPSAKAGHGQARTHCSPNCSRPIEVASPENWQIAVDGMIQVMNAGTGSRSQAGAEYQIAGKTGTAQVFTVKQNERYEESKLDERLHDHGWFICLRAGRRPEDRGRRDHRERQAWHRRRGDRPPRARPVPAGPHHHARDSTARGDRGWRHDHARRASPPGTNRCTNPLKSAPAASAPSPSPRVFSAH